MKNTARNQTLDQLIQSMGELKQHANGLHERQLANAIIILAAMLLEDE